jgi:hypothetical protein
MADQRYFGMGKDFLEAEQKKRKMRSRYEAAVAVRMDQAGLEYEYEPIRIRYATEEVYIPDLRLPNGIIVELKGYFKAEDRMKLTMVREQHPEYDIRLVFQNNSFIHSGSKTRYGDWCNKHGFKWAVGDVPAAWWEE